MERRRWHLAAPFGLVAAVGCAGAKGGEASATTVTVSCVHKQVSEVSSSTYCTERPSLPHELIEAYRAACETLQGDDAGFPYVVSGVFSREACSRANVVGGCMVLTKEGPEILWIRDVETTTVSQICFAHRMAFVEPCSAEKRCDMSVVNPGDGGAGEQTESAQTPPRPLGGIDTSATVYALTALERAVARCGTRGGPAGIARVAVVFEPSGRVSSVTIQTQAFAGTATGDCIVQNLMTAQVPPFVGGPVTARKMFSVE